MDKSIALLNWIQRFGLAVPSILILILIPTPTKRASYLHPILSPQTTVHRSIDPIHAAFNGVILLLLELDKLRVLDTSRRGTITTPRSTFSPSCAILSKADSLQLPLAVICVYNGRELRVCTGREVFASMDTTESVVNSGNFRELHGRRMAYVRSFTRPIHGSSIWICSHTW